MCELRKAYVKVETIRDERERQKLEQLRDSWEISEWEFGERHDAIMERTRLRFVTLLDEKEWESYRMYHGTK